MERCQILLCAYDGVVAECAVEWQVANLYWKCLRDDYYTNLEREFKLINKRSKQNDPNAELKEKRISKLMEHFEKVKQNTDSNNINRKFMNMKSRKKIAINNLRYLTNIP